MKAISLFSCGGIGDLALRHSGFDVVVANEFVPERAEVFKQNYPEVEMIVGDIWEEKHQILKAAKRLAPEGLDIVFATPPCQGMSKNGRGKLLSLIRKGQKDVVDHRNLLVIPTVDIFLSSKAHTLVMENVPEMENTCIPDPKNDGELIGIIDYIIRELGSEFFSCVRVVEFADYGVPQCRQRLISIFTKNPRLVEYLDVTGTLHPPKTHSRAGGRLPKWVTVRNAIGRFPPLDAKTKDASVSNSIAFHTVPTLDEEKYFWVSNTPEEKGAFDNQCVNPSCLFSENPTHFAAKDADGINRASLNTPIRCIKCNELLPRPWVRDGDSYRLMKGFTSAYKRMKWDMPASTLTRNLSYACSDNKLHPVQNRVLSLHEAMVLHTITDYDYKWQRSDGKKLSDKVIRELIGESIPPAGLEKIFGFLKGILDGRIVPAPREEDDQYALF